MKNALKLESITKWLPTASKPIIISGPCSAETEDQMIAPDLDNTKEPEKRD
jgi:chorismate mutase